MPVNSKTFPPSLKFPVCYEPGQTECQPGLILCVYSQSCCLLWVVQVFIFSKVALNTNLLGPLSCLPPHRRGEALHVYTKLFTMVHQPQMVWISALLSSLCIPTLWVERRDLVTILRRGSMEYITVARDVTNSESRLPPPPNLMWCTLSDHLCGQLN